MTTASMTLRPPMTPLARRIRAFFAPVDRTTDAPTLFDPAAQRAFAVAAPPAPWVDLGWIENFRRPPHTRVEPWRAGPKGAPGGLFRAQLEARVEFEFLQWGKLQMALAGGAQHVNVLAPASETVIAPCGGPAAAAVALLAGSTATELRVPLSQLGDFAAGDLVAADVDYSGQTGYVGSGVAGAYVASTADIGGDADFIRRVTFNVARVADVTADALALAQPLLGGVPPSGAAVQKVVAFVDREGGSFFQQWSALFVLENESGGRIVFYYPRLAASAPAQELRMEVAPPLEAVALRASFIALPYADPLDGEQVVCYRGYFPAPSAALY